MATTISSGTNPYKLGSPPDFGTLYSGRALEFDGVTDYVSLDKININGTSGTTTISAWVRTDDAGVTQNIFANTYDTDNRVALQVKGDEAIIGHSSGSSKSGTILDNTWTHLVGTIDDGTYSLYINGEAQAGTSSISSCSSTQVARIGSRADSSTELFNGDISNFQIWDKVWSLTDAQYAYTHPEKLITHNSAVTSGTTISNLKAWYPCIEGSPRSPQTTVYDGSPKELGSELVSSNVSSEWTDNSNSSTITNITGGVSIADDSGYSDIGHLRSGTSTTGLLSTDFTLTKLYKVSFNAYHNGTGTPNIRLNNGSATEVITISDTNTLYTRYIVSTTSVSDPHIRTNNNSSGSIVYITNLSVKEVKVGNHGTTTFYGDEMHTLSTCTSPTNEADATTGWTNVGFDTFASDTKGDEPAAQGSHSLHLTAGDSGDYCKLASPITLVEGRAYEINITYIINGAGKNLYAKWGSSDGGTEYGANTLNSQSWYTAKTTKTATGTTLYVQIHEVAASDDSDGYIGTLSVKEIGVATGWTTADAEPLIPQTALMGMSKPMVFDGTDDNVEITHDDVLDLGGSDMSVHVNIIPYSIPSSGDVRPISKNNQYAISLQSTGKILFTIPYVGSATQDDTVLSAGKQYDIVVTWEGTNIRYYINGALTSTATSFSDSANAGTNANLDIGSGEGTEKFFNGIINEVSVWNHDLSLAEVQELFNDGVALDATTHSRASNLKGYWRNTGTGTWTDLSGEGNNGTPANATETILLPEGTTSGKDILGFPLTHPNNGWLNLSGSEYVDCGSSSVFDDMHAKNMTVEAWIKPNGSTANLGIVNKTNNASQGWYFAFDSFSSSTWHLRFTAIHATTNALSQKNNQISPDVWTHVAVTYGGIGTAALLYKNGAVLTSLDTNTASAGAVTTDASYNVTIGARQSTVNDLFPGAIDEVRVYNRELTAAEITKNYKHGKGKHPN